MQQINYDALIFGNNHTTFKYLYSNMYINSYMCTGTCCTDMFQSDLNFMEYL